MENEKIIEKEIGSRFILDGISVEVAASSWGDCTGCAFHIPPYNICSRPATFPLYPCSALYRKDKQSVIFKRVKK